MNRESARLAAPLRRPRRGRPARPRRAGAYAVLLASATIVLSGCAMQGGPGASLGLPGGQISTVDAQDAMRLAEARYTAGDYAAACATYRWLDAAGLRKPALQANLASACLAEGDLGCAMLGAARASAMAPREPAIQRRLDVIEARAGIAAARGTWRWGRSFLTLGEILLLTLLAWNLAALASIVERRLRLPAARAIRLSLLGLALAGAGMSAGRWIDARWRPEAVVMATEPQMLSSAPGPAETGSAAIEIAPGSRVQILDTRDGYVRLRLLGQQLSGWLPDAAVERIGLP